jgi:hypothetical protein
MAPSPQPSATPVAAPKPVASPAPRLPAPKPVVAPAPVEESLPQWPLGVTALLGGLAGWLLWRRKSKAAAAETPETEDSAIAPAPPPPAEPVVDAAPVITEPVVVAAPPAPPAPVFEPAPFHAAPVEELSLDFEPTRFATTLSEATLRYRLTVTNISQQPLGPLAINGRMEAASEEEEQQPEPEVAPSPVAPEPPAFAALRRGLPAQPAVRAEGRGGGSHRACLRHLERWKRRNRPKSRQRRMSGTRIMPPRTAPPCPAPRSDEEAPAAPDAAPGTVELHRLMMLSPGGASRCAASHLPLAAIAPMRVGAAELFVPLVTLSVEAERIVEEGNPSPPPPRSA